MTGGGDRDPETPPPPPRSDARFRENAPAKINLTLRIIGRRRDGCHRLVSLTAFSEIGDEAAAFAADAVAGPRLVVEGPFAAALCASREEGEDLILAAARSAAGARAAAFRFHLFKRLPIAAGLGGGSADAAAALRALHRVFGVAPPPPARLVEIGADLPACLASRAGMMRGIGEDYRPLGAFPPLWAVLVNGGGRLKTAVVFDRLGLQPGGDACGDDDDEPPIGAQNDAHAMIAWIARRGNDLQEAARGLAPPIDDVLAVLRTTPEVVYAAMSGSGPTCFGLCTTAAAAQAACRGILERIGDARRRRWWTVWGRLS